MTRQPDRIAVAAAQYPLEATGSMEVWTGKISRWVAEGAAAGARLLVFPEYGSIELAAIHGDAVAADLGATLRAVADADDATAQIWRGLAARHGVYILAPSGPSKRGEAYVNAARLFAPSGAIGVQDKLILTPFERDWGLVAGHAQRVFDTELGRIGIAICYDSEFPLLVRALAEAGADIILIPACTEHESGSQRVRTAAMARALEGQISTVVSSTIGESSWSTVVDRNYGAAGIFVPPDIALAMTGVLAEGEPNAAGWIVGEIDVAGLARLREDGEMRNRADWSKQPGAQPLAGRVEVYRLD